MKVADLLSVDAAPADEDPEQLYLSFVQKTWRELPLYNEQGSALGTASCIPVWEMLHSSSSSYNSHTDTDKAFVIQLLTAMYPKPKDRRVTFQQIDYLGSGTAGVALSWRSPASSESLRLILPEVMYAHITAGVALRHDAGPLGPTILSSALRVFLQNIVPNVTIISTKRNGSRSELAVRWRGESFGFHCFLVVLWKYLILAELHGVPACTDIYTLLTTSSWAHKTVVVDGRSLVYKAILAPLLDASKILLLCNSRCVSNAADNLPSIDPRIELQHVGDWFRVTNAADSSSANALPSHTIYGKETDPAFATERDENLSERLESRIAAAVNISGLSSLARDCDQLTLLCRDMMFSTAGAMHCRPARRSRMEDLLFSRERQRSRREGPVFLPTTSSLSDVLEGKDDERSTLERIACGWAAA